MQIHLKRKKGLDIDNLEISTDASDEEQIKIKYCDNVSLERSILIMSF